MPHYFSATGAHVEPGSNQRSVAERARTWSTVWARRALAISLAKQAVAALSGDVLDGDPPAHAPSLEMLAIDHGSSVDGFSKISSLAGAGSCYQLKSGVFSTVMVLPLSCGVAPSSTSAELTIFFNRGVSVSWAGNGSPTDLPCPVGDHVCPPVPVSSGSMITKRCLTIGTCNSM